jgi:hypothetical protein
MNAPSPATKHLTLALRALGPLSGRPEAHVALVAFTLWSSIAHGAVMAVQSLADPRHTGHLYGDVPALFLVAAVLGWPCPAALSLRFAKS